MAQAQRRTGSWTTARCWSITAGPWRPFPSTRRLRPPRRARSPSRRVSEKLVEPLAPEEVALDPDRVIDARTEVGSLWLERDAVLITPTVLKGGAWAGELTALMHAVLRPGMTLVDAG